MRTYAALCFAILLQSSRVTDLAPTLETMQITSPVYRITRQYRSMEGPSTVRLFSILDSKTPELVWLTAFQANVVGVDGVTPLSAEFMCHSNLDMDVERHKRLFPLSAAWSGRLFTVSQGQPSVILPDGFGIPVLSNEAFTLV